MSHSLKGTDWNQTPSLCDMKVCTPQLLLRNDSAAFMKRIIFELSLPKKTSITMLLQPNAKSRGSNVQPMGCKLQSPYLMYM